MTHADGGALPTCDHRGARSRASLSTYALLLTIICLVLFACGTNVETTATRELDRVATEGALEASNSSVTGTSVPSATVQNEASLPVLSAAGWCAAVDAFAAFDDHLGVTVAAKDDFDLLAVAATNIVADLHAADAALAEIPDSEPSRDAIAGWRDQIRSAIPSMEAIAAAASTHIASEVAHAAMAAGTSGTAADHAKLDIRAYVDEVGIECPV